MSNNKNPIHYSEPATLNLNELRTHVENALKETKDLGSEACGPGLLTSNHAWQTRWWTFFKPSSLQTRTADPTWNYSGHTLMDILTSEVPSQPPNKDSKESKRDRKRMMTEIAKKLVQCDIPPSFYDNAMLKREVDTKLLKRSKRK